MTSESTPMDEVGSPDTGEEEARPWEADPSHRRDAAPHRGNWMEAGSVAAFLLWVPGVVCPCFAALGVPLALLVWWVAAHDLRKMRAREMDAREGEHAAAARIAALACLVFPAFGCLVWVVLAAELFIFLL
jgi:hypothetical protein